MLGSRLFHRPFRGQTDADGLPYIADNTEADLLVGGAGDDNLLGDRVFGVSDAQNWGNRGNRKIGVRLQLNKTPSLLTCIAANFDFASSSHVSGIIPTIGSGFDATVWKHRLTGKDSHKIQGMATPATLLKSL